MFIKRNDAFKFVENKLGMIIYQFKDAELINAIEVNESAAEIIKLANGNLSIEELLNLIKKRNHIPDSETINQILDYINYLIKSDILQLNPNKQNSIPVCGNKNLIIPTQIIVEVTKKCQLKCIHCFNSSGNQLDNELSSNELIDILEEFSKLGTLQILLTGGEPLLKDNIIDIIDFCCKNFYSVIIGTNAVAINDNFIQHIKKYKNISFTISVDGLEQTHDFFRGVKGCYSKTMENITKLIDSNFSVSISYTLNEYNYKEVNQIAHKVKNMGCSGINLGYILNKGRAKESFVPTISTNKYLKTMNEVFNKFNDNTFNAKNESCDTGQEDVFLESIPYENKCGAGYRVLSLKSDGNLYPCPTCEDIKLGNIKLNSIEKVLSSDIVMKMLNIVTPCKKICGNCEQLPLCKNCISRVLEKNKEQCKLKEVYYGQKIINS